MTVENSNHSSNGASTVTTISTQEMVIERGEAQGVNLHEIEKGLTALWQGAAKPDGTTEGNAVMRACVFNLIICIEDEHLTDVTKTIAEITWQFPCRAIVLVREPENPLDSYEAFISAHCQMPNGGRKVCCEQITIIGRGKSAEGLWSLVLPLLVADLPVILWWPGDPRFEETLFARLIQTSDRLIVDSRAFSQPAATFARLAQLLKEQNGTVAFADLSWSRLTGWRTLLAEFFDEPRYRQLLLNVDQVAIEYEAPDDNNMPNFSEAMLLVGWLSERLGWQTAFNIQRRGNHASLILNQHGAPLQVNFTGHNDRKDDLGGITRVTLKASGVAEVENSASYAFTIALTEDYERANAIIEENGTTIRNRSVLFPKKSRTQLLVEDLAVVGHDHLYEAALEIAGSFNRS